jgi:tight adherence protein C
MLYLAFALAFIAVALLAIQLFPHVVKVEEAEQAQMPALYRTFRPAIRYLATLNRRLPVPGIRAQYARRIERAGLTFDMSPDDFLAVKEFALIGGAAFGVLVYFGFGLVREWWVVPVGVLLGFMVPDVLLSDAAKKREHGILRALPDFLDLLTLSVEAGLDLVGAVRKVADRFEPGPLVWEFRAYLQDLTVGKSRSDALRYMVRKLDLPDFSSFGNAVIQATEAGASVGPVLRMQAQDMRSRRFQRSEKLAHEAPVKMLFPMIAFIFPAVFLIILGALYFQFKASGALNVF